MIKNIQSVEIAALKSQNSRPIFVILVSGLGLRLINIVGRGIWYDDAFSILLSNRQIAEIISGTAADTMPPMYYFLLHFWGLISQNIWYLRSLNVLLSTAVIFLVFLLVRRISTDRAAIIAAILTAISPFQIYHAQELRMYVILELALLIHIIFFMDIFVQFEHGTKVRWKYFWLAVSGIIALYSHNLAIFTIVALDLFLIITKNIAGLRKYLIVQGLMAIALIPWLVFLPGQIDKIQAAFWTPKPGIVQIIQAALTMLATLPLTQTGTYVCAVLIAFVLVIFIRNFQVSNLRNPSHLMVSCLVVIPPILLFFASWFMRPIFVPRAFIVSGLLFYILIGMTLAGGEYIFDRENADHHLRYRLNSLSIVGLVVFVIISGISLPYQYTYHSFPRSDFLQMIQSASDGCKENCVVVHDNKLSYFPSLIYDETTPQNFIKDEPGSHNDTLAYNTQQAMDIYAISDIQSAVGKKSDIRFVVFSKTLQEYLEMGGLNHPKIDWLRTNYIEMGHKFFGDMEIFYFIKQQ